MWTKNQLHSRIAAFVTCSIVAATMPIGSLAVRASALQTDNTFGSGGITEFGSSPGESATSVLDIAIDSQGRTVSLVTVQTVPDESATVVIRSLASGVVDRSFSEDGRTDPIKNINAQGLVIQWDGKILIAGSSKNRNGMSAVRFNDDGQIDTTFGTQGTASTPLFGTRQIAGVVQIALQPTSGFVMAVSMGSLRAPNNELIFAAFNDDGTTNGNFGTAGIATVFPTRRAASRLTTLEDIAIQADDGSVLATVNGITETQSGFGVTWVVRLTPDGILDTTFDGANSGNGIVELKDGNTSDLLMTSMVINSDDSITMAGLNGTYNGSHSVASIKISASGDLDLSYGHNGIMMTNIASTSTVVGSLENSIAGKFLLTATTEMDMNSVNPSTAYVISISSNGTLDTSFDTDGIKSIPNEGSSTSQAVALGLNQNGTFIVGITQKNIGYQFSLIRVSSSGVVDGTYGTSGKFTLAIALVSHDLVNQRLLERPNGKLLLISNVVLNWSMFGATTYAIELVQMNADGLVDTTFGTNGHVQLKDLTNSTSWSDISIQSDGRVLIAASVERQNASDSVLYRLTSAGSLDTTFDGDGIRQFDFNNYDWIGSVSQIPNGDILLSGVSSDLQWNSNSWISQLHADGSLNTSFDGDSGTADGVVALTNFSPVDVVPVSDGYVLVGQDGTSAASIMKLDLGGRVVTSFATNGQGAYPISDGNGGFEYASLDTVQIRPNGGFIAFGGTSSNGSYSPLLVAFDRSGNLDATFDGPSGTGNGVVEFVQPTTGTLFQGASLSVDGDGFLLTGILGTVNGGTLQNVRPVLQRVTPAGIIDTSFGTNGQLLVNVASSGASATGGIVSSSGGLLLFGSHQTTTEFGEKSFVTKLISPQTNTSTSSSSTSSTSSTTSTTSSTTSTTSSTTSTTSSTTSTTVPVGAATQPVLVTTTIAIVMPSSIAVGKLVKRSALLAQFNISVPKGSNVVMTTSTAKTCTVVGTSVKALKKGSCSIRFTVTPTKGTAKRYARTLTVA
jgi:uncharacterized delta-60 repeat protein